MRRTIASLSVLACLHGIPAEAAENPATAAMTMNHADHDHSGMLATHGAARPMSWTGYPLLRTRMSGENRKRTVTIMPQNLAVGSVDAYSNNLKSQDMHRQLPLEIGGASLGKPDTGGFQWLAAREEQPDKVLVASAVYYFGERGAKNPTAMFMQQKYELEIVPQPYPREHSRYRADEDWRFLVRFNGQPLANQKVVLETQNGSKAEFVSDAQGVVTVHLPNDFKAEEETAQNAGKHSHGVRASDFVLAVEHAEGGKTYITAFNGSYRPDAFDKRSLAMGLGFTLIGGLCAVPLLRQRKIAATGNTLAAASASSGKEEV